jgi:hypothetical protein
MAGRGRPERRAGMHGQAGLALPHPVQRLVAAGPLRQG